MFRFVFLMLFLSLGNVCAQNETTVAPTTTPATTTAPTTGAPVVPTTLAPTTLAPTTKAPIVVPTTLAPTTIAPPVVPTTLAPTTIAPPVVPTTLAPTTEAPVVPTTLAPTTKPTTLPPAPPTNATTVAPTTDTTTVAPTTNATTVAPTTNATTVAPTTNATTVAPTTNATTVAPTTNATTAAPTTPTPPLPTPDTGKYYIKQDVNGSVCLMADFGLRISFKQGDKQQEMNLDPNRTVAVGDCSANSSQLTLTDDKITVILSFSNDVKNFHLQAVNVTIQTGEVPFSAVNSTLSLWQAAVGSSYMCNKQQVLNITDALTLSTYQLRVQPFKVSKDQFSTAEECFLDADFTFLVPVAVGVALSFLIILVLISYLIGRRKSRTGYQSV